LGGQREERGVSEEPGAGDVLNRGAKQALK